MMNTDAFAREGDSCVCDFDPKERLDDVQRCGGTICLDGNGFGGADVCLGRGPDHDARVCGH